MNTAPAFPPLFSSEGVSGSADPFTKACTQAMLGCDAGLVVHNVALDQLRAAIVFAPEVPLRRAAAALIACGIGFQNALGALAPPEVAVHLTWSGGLRINGAACGRLRIAASGEDPEVEPAWLVVGLEVPLTPPPGAELGQHPDETYLYEEGCVDVGAITLLEAWVRHSLPWLNRMDENDMRALHAEWRGLAHDIGEDITLPHDGQPRTGTFLGVDENFGLLLRDGADTHLIPLTTCLETRP